MVKENSYYFYVLLCADNTLYGWFTTDLIRRLNQHNDGVGAKYTRLKKRRPVEMIYHEKFSSKSMALKKEYAFKHQFNWMINKIIAIHTIIKYNLLSV